MIDAESHEYLASLYSELDRQRAEHAKWMAAREAQASPLVRRNDDAGILYRDAPEPGQNAAAASDTAASYPADGNLVRAVAEFVVLWTDEKLAPERTRIAKLEAKLAALERKSGRRKRGDAA